MPKQTIYDVIVVGSGATGGWAAKELTEKGLRVIMLEAGRKLDPAKDFRMLAFPYDLKYRNLIPQTELLRKRQPIQSKCYACDEYASHFFVDDVDNPYTTAEGKSFDWIRGRQVGGRTLMWGRQSYRFSDYEFKAASRDGFGVDWPISHADLAPYYERVERFVGISGAAENLPQLPDSSLPAAYVHDLRRAVAEKRRREQVERPPRDHGPRRDADPSPQRARGLPLLRPLRARLRHLFVFQHARLDSARRDEDRQADSAPRRRLQPRHRGLQHRQGQGRRIH